MKKMKRKNLEESILKLRLINANIKLNLLNLKLTKKLKS